MTTMSSAEPTRRDFLYIATASLGAVGAAATVWPLVAQMNPDASTIAAGAPIDVDLGPITDFVHQTVRAKLEVANPKYLGDP